ncbi:MAG: helix-turn-helix domain-containing protein [Prevotellaceae bacterium]|jgi:transcriptional regulator with XRE-family HTH domain|nr:helix-turn-helix domain-containing protein [Prevotellaceae bacterium]
MESFGQFIRNLRTSRGYTLTELGAKLKIDSAGLSKIETGNKKMKPERLPLLAEVFNLDLDKLKEQFYSEEIAMKLYKYDCPESTLIVAEEKVKYLKQHSSKQDGFKF